MTAVLIVAAILLIFLWIGHSKCSVEAAVQNGSFSYAIHCAGIQVLPRKRKAKPKAEAAPQEKKSQAPKKKRQSGELKQYVDLALRLLRRFSSKLRIDLLRVHFVSAFADPYDTAMAYNFAGVSMEAASAILNGRVKTLDLRAEMDFDHEGSAIDAALRMSVRIGELSLMALAGLFGYRKLRRSFKNAQKMERKIQNGQSGNR